MLLLSRATGDMEAAFRIGPVEDNDYVDFPARGLSMSGPKQLALNTEYPAPNEDQLAHKLVELLRGTVEQRFLQGMTYRGVNTKSHAAVRASLIVDPNLPEHLRIGLFKTPRTYPAWIRF